MPFEFEKTPLEGVVVITPKVFPDDRGFFMETYREDHFRDAGLPVNFVQDNHSCSRRGVVRGLHFQWEPPAAKLMRVTTGAAFLVAVDVRKGSPQFGEWYGVEITAENKKQLYAPAGFARGFCVLSDSAELQYKCTGLYNVKAESGILWNDPDVGIEWPLSDPILSEKDRNAQTLAQWAENPLSEHFRYP
jgi:dTDP-4-dehydrorhamnose 3,5-epimerase